MLDAQFKIHHLRKSRSDLPLQSAQHHYQLSLRHHAKLSPRQEGITQLVIPRPNTTRGILTTKEIHKHIVNFQVCIVIIQLIMSIQSGKKFQHQTI